MFTTRDWGAIPNPQVMQTMLEFYWKDRQSIRVLDLGCGFGANTWYLAAEGYATYAIDGSETAIKHASKSIKKGTAKLWHGDIINLPYPDNYFDCVIDICAISCNNLLDSHKIYKECSRVMKRGAVLYSQGFAQGTDRRCFANGIFNRISNIKEIDELVCGFFITESKNKVSRSTKEHLQVVEWQLTLRKP